MLTCLVWASARDGEQLSIMIHEWASSGPGSESGVSVAAAGCCRGGMVVTARCRVTSGESSGGHQHQLPPSSWAQQCSAVTSGDTVTWTSVNSEAAAAMQWSARHQDSPLSSCHPPWSRETRCHTVCLHTLWVSWVAEEEGRWSPWKHGHSCRCYPVSLMEFIGLSLLSLKIHSFICRRTIDATTSLTPPFNLFILLCQHFQHQ